jgi:predicted phosphodiesterase
MKPRTIAIGDIHGCSAALNTLIRAIQPRQEDCIVTLGDYINRGPDSRGVMRVIKIIDSAPIRIIDKISLTQR